MDTVMTNEYKFKGGIRTGLIVLMVIGVISMIFTFIGDDELNSRFWSNFLINSVFFTGIAFVALILMAGKYIAYSGWQTVFKRIWESYSLFLLPGLILMAILVFGVFGGFHQLYHWNFEGIADPSSDNYDEIIAGKSGFLNKYWYGIGTIVILGVWYLFARKIRSLSLLEDQEGDDSYKIHFRIKKWAGVFLPIGGFTSAALIWLWIMSIDSHWYSTLFAWYATISLLVAMIALTILTLLYLKANGYMNQVHVEHLHDLGKYLFGFSIFWTYLWFSQYMLIWYGNIGEETVYFKERLDNYPVLFFGLLFLNFIAPFFVLMRNDTKRKVGTMTFAAIVVFIGHWLDFFLMVKPGVLHTTHEALGHGHHGTEAGHDVGAHGAEAASHGAGHGAEIAHEAVAHGVEHVSSFVAGFSMPGFLEIGTMLGFFGLFMFLVLRSLSSAPLIPKNDPYLGESIHHHV